ncbi:MAG: NAD-dependent deacylase [Anaerolineae bacterium]|nr:NAD-dependent deacylase [Anaerolineae bacterium]
MSFQKAVEILSRSKNTVVLTGAGISTPSGIPDFRSNSDGLWNRYNPMEVASLNAFRLRPEKFFDWIQPLVSKIIDAKPNPAHTALARLEKAGLIEAVITQNIDGLHQRSGSKNVHEIHGSLNSLTCVSCYKKHQALVYIQPFLDDGALPKCTECGAMLKPDAILFGEQLPIAVWQKSKKVAQSCSVMLVAGSSLEVVPVAGLPMEAVRAGSKLIIVNHTSTYIDSRADVVINEDVAEVLPKIADEILQS